MAINIEAFKQHWPTLSADHKQVLGAYFVISLGDDPDLLNTTELKASAPLFRELFGLNVKTLRQKGLSEIRSWAADYEQASEDGAPQKLETHSQGIR